MPLRACAVVAVCLVVLVGYPHSSRASDLFSSSSNVAELFRTEKELVPHIREFIQEQKTLLEELEALADRSEAVPLPKTDMHLKPFDGYSVIQRTLDLLSAARNIGLHANNTSTLHAFVADNAENLPQHSDLDGASDAILRLQRTYERQATDLFPKQRANGRDFFTVGRKAYLQQDYFAALPWLRLAAEHVHDGSEVDRASLYDHLAFVEYKSGFIRRALNISKELLAIQPLARVRNNVQYYESILSTQQSAAMGADGSSSAKTQEEQPDVEPSVKGYNFHEDNLLEHTENDMANYRQLCRGHSLMEPDHTAKCYYTHRNNPALFLKPQAIEEIMPNTVQDVKMYRDFATAEEVDRLIELGRGSLERAVAYTDNKFTATKFRISTVAWMRDNRDGLVAKIDARIAKVTGLDLRTAEQLQVSNYGIGGHYEPHFDYFGEDRVPVESGNRLATFMIYLNNVDAGGSTAFPKLGVTVPPRKGDAVFWFNLQPDGIGNPNTLHAGCPVLKGSKWVANKWIHRVGNGHSPVTSS